MPLFSFKCSSCSKTTEKFFKNNCCELSIKCACGATASRIMECVAKADIWRGSKDHFENVIVSEVEKIQEKIDALEQFCDELDNAASECEDWDMDSESPQPGEDHTAECASHNETPECDCGHDGQPDSDNNETCSPDCASMQEVYSDCDCGYDELEQEKEQWEQEQKEKINAAFETAENAIGELSI